MNPMQIWNEFREKLQRDELTAEDCIPHSGIDYSRFFEDEHTQPLKNFIARQDEPRIEHGEEKLVFTLSSGDNHEIRLDFVVRENRWYFYLIDGLTIPLKEIPDLPLSEFQPYPFENRMRAEDVITKKVYLYLKLREEKGKEEALSWFHNGEGYRLNLESWMPYFTQRKAFVLFTAWRENRYWGQEMEVRELSDIHSVLLFKDHEYFMLYDVAGHLRPRISPEDYRELFEDKWRNRAGAVGWNVRFEYDEYDTKMILDAAE
ncbi:MAG: hypothetical protein HOC74_32125 [Gemmatimonadetes bacterium]|jgi:hypothetical protein|nr:hypothetical protein [Gemmatimonadota bacterium]